MLSVRRVTPRVWAVCPQGTTPATMFRRAGMTCSASSQRRFAAAAPRTTIYVRAPCASTLPSCPSSLYSATLASSTAIAASPLMVLQQRFARVRPAAPGDDSGSSEGGAKQQEQQSEQQQTEGAGGSGGQQKPGGAQERAGASNSGSGGIKAHIDGLKMDMVTFPDIYNSANFINMLLFTVFCLCSTGSQVEAEWWEGHWGVDGSTVRPYAWLLHSLYMNNFMSIAFAMIMFHGMSHSIMAQLGSRGLLEFCLIVSVFSGAMIWGTNRFLLHGPDGKGSEKQYGPWDVIAALFVVQYLSFGIMPHTFLLSHSGWVKYACIVGAICITYYDWQPLAWGTLAGLVLCKTRFPAVKVAAPGA